MAPAVFLFTTMDIAFRQLAFEQEHLLWIGQLPAGLGLDPVPFEELWNLHPPQFPEIKMHGRCVRTPRWQQSYGIDYAFAGRVSRALPVPSILDPLLEWCRRTIDLRLNGLLVNWYDSALGHYIGAHRDSVTNRIAGSPIVMISFGQSRTFRLRPWRAVSRGRHLDIDATSMTVIVMPWQTNLACTHEIPPHRGESGRRISVTLRCFDS